jgi:hypothetical protein
MQRMSRFHNEDLTDRVDKDKQHLKTLCYKELITHDREGMKVMASWKGDFFLAFSSASIDLTRRRCLHP